MFVNSSISPWCNLILKGREIKDKIEIERKGRKKMKVRDNRQIKPKQIDRLKISTQPALFLLG